MKNLAPFNSCEMSCTVGMGCRIRLIAVFAARMSIHRRILSSFFGTMTIGDIHSVASVSGTRLMIDFSSQVEWNATLTLSNWFYIFVNKQFELLFDVVISRGHKEHLDTSGQHVVQHYL